MTKLNKRHINFYLKVLAVQEAYLKNKRDGVSNRYVFRTYIKNTFFINERTMYKYLAINSKRALKEINQEDDKCEQ